MKRLLIVLFCLSALISGLSISASAQPQMGMWIKVPFAFHAGDRLMPAGKYLFEMPKMGGFATGTMLRVISLDGSECQHLLSQRINGVITDNDYHVTFTKYGETYFLNKVRNGDLGAALARSRAEKRVASEYSPKASGTVTSVELVGMPKTR